jgi:hypothetical protein
MFYTEYATTPEDDWLSNVASTYKSNQDTETYAITGANSRMGEIKGGSEGDEYNVYDISVPNKHYGNHLIIPEKDMIRDKTGQIMDRVGEKAEDALSFDQYQISQLILAGESSLAYDSQYFYDTDHESGSSGVQSNIVTVDISTLPAVVHGIPSAPSPEEIQQVVAKGVAQMVSFKNDKGSQENRNIQEIIVMLPFGLWNVMFNASAMPNQAGVSAQPVVNMGDFRIRYILNFDLAAWTDQFSIFRADGRAKSFIVQEETPMRMQLEHTPTSENGYRFRWGIDSWRGYGYGRWERSVLCKMV